ncbi:115aa long hypothetical protein [Pyrococcus horikoshii OT3]|uniref:Uncharacterized protein n=1 Tax=Pyrococcus horikoshii (strain ATCC 700860 / DSM 12428 / JCM 9974 / NBRC 100139 / OT-3) TaxID=70601 RepID=O57858_PYRHO|nr:115aa long hypothetical protein [Pyrococcus horikoshii OT3]
MGFIPSHKFPGLFLRRICRAFRLLFHLHSAPLTFLCLLFLSFHLAISLCQLLGLCTLPYLDISQRGYLCCRTLPLDYHFYHSSGGQTTIFQLLSRLLRNPLALWEPLIHHRLYRV